MRGEIVAGVLIFLALPFASWSALRTWRADELFADAGGNRAMPLAVALSWPFFGIGFAALLSHGDARTVLGLLWIVVLAAGCVLVPSVYFVGRPRSLVPPHLRDGAHRPPAGERPERPARKETAGDAAFARRSYRDPQGIWMQLFELLLLAGLSVLILWAGIGDLPVGILLGLVIVVLGAVALRAGVVADAEGVTVREQFARTQRFPWDRIARFELGPNEEGGPEPWLVLTDGEEFPLEPLEGMHLQPRKRRWEWAERSLAGLTAQLRSRSLREG